MSDNTFDREVEHTMSPEEEQALIRSTRRFDLRRILGGLFVVYGVIVLIIGLVNNTSDMKKTGGLPINIVVGAAMLVAGLLFFLWDRLAPVPEEDIIKTREAEDEERAEGEGEREGTTE